MRYLMELSKYIIIILMACYVLESMYSLFRSAGKTGAGLYVRQCILLFFIQFFSYFSLCLRSGNIDYLFFYVFLQIVLFSGIILFQMIYPGIDRCLLNNMALLLSVGFIILTRLDFKKSLKQFAIMTGSFALSMAVPYMIKKIKNPNALRWGCSAAGIISLLLVLILGQATHGSKISFSIAGISIQPSEIVKIIFVFAVASFLWESDSIKNILISGAVAASHVLILVLSKDLGSALIFFVGYVFMVFIASGRYLYLLAGAAGAGAASIAAYQLFSHVRVRVQAFLDPFSVIDKEGYQITQSLFALACGGFFGTGLLKGLPQNIPYVESDFIFSAVSEEMGVLFAIGVLLICLISFLVFLKYAFHLKNRFFRLTAAGLGVMYIFQVFLTVGGGIKFIPLTGVTLPFISYGGSSVLTSILIFSVMQGIVLVKKEEDDSYEKECGYEDEYDRTQKEDKF